MTALQAANLALQAAIDLADQDDERSLRTLDTAVRDPAQGPWRAVRPRAAHRTAHRVTPGVIAALADDSGGVPVEAAAALAMVSRR